jgi:hypothetical protein
LAFKLFYRPGVRLAASEVLARLAAGKPGVLSQPGLYVGMISGVSLMFGLLGWAIGRLVVAQAVLGEPAMRAPDTARADPSSSKTTAL